MKLFVRNSRNEKVYLNLIANSRYELAHKIGQPSFILKGEIYVVDQVKAESDSSNAVGGLIIGGILGLMTGGIGAFVGGALGGAIGNSADNDDQKRVKAFNASRYYY
jgi:hypothetical protein